MAVCFDLDWTLSTYPLSTAQVLEESLERTAFPSDRLGSLEVAARRYNELWLALERSAPSTASLRDQIMLILFEESGTADADGALRLSQTYGDIRRETGVLTFPGVKELLADLRPHYKLGLLTNGRSDMQWEKIGALGLNDMFDAIVVAGDIGIYKPDSRAFRHLLGRLDVPAAQSLFVGDSYDTDILGAHNAGMVTAWISRDSRAPIDGIQPTFVKHESVGLREELL
jgi:HAD superfamily hydrolase (TIGR01549 family)